MADITEQQELAQEISDVISRPVGFGEEYDEVRAVNPHFYFSFLYLQSVGSAVGSVLFGF